MPAPLMGAPTALIVHVPWPLKSWIVGSVGTKDTLSATSRLGATSTCDWSAPVSMTKTRTSLRPCCTAYDPVGVAWSFFLSHCSEPSESGIGCVSDPVGDAVPPLLPLSAICASRFAGSIVGPIDVSTEGAADFTDALRPIAAAKLGLSDVTPIPPICGKRVVIVPPAAATNWSTFDGRLFGELNATVYCTAGFPAAPALPITIDANVNARIARAAKVHRPLMLLAPFSPPPGDYRRRARAL